MEKLYNFKKYQPLNLRLWHWMNALVILGLLLTVLLRKTFLSWRANAQLIQDKMQAAGTAVSPEVAGTIAKEMRNNMWDWHIYLGFVLGALLLYRLIGYFVDRKTVRQHASASFASTPPTNLHKWHYNLVQTTYAVFYLITLFMVLSGLALNFEESLHLGEGLEDFLKEGHELMMWFFIVFIVGHLAGVIFTENTKDKGIISDMFNGGA